MATHVSTTPEGPEPRFRMRLVMGLELLFEEAPGQEGKSEREKEWRILGANMDAARPANFYRLLCAQADVGKIGSSSSTRSWRTQSKL